MGNAFASLRENVCQFPFKKYISTEQFNVFAHVHIDVICVFVSLFC